jgi:hypothetical protein
VDVIGLVWATGMAGLALWFWPHCAVPALHEYRASPLAHQVGFALTAAMIVVPFVVVAGDMLAPSSGWRALLLLTGFLWLGIVGSTQWPEYAPLLRLHRK